MLSKMVTRPCSVIAHVHLAVHAWCTELQQSGKAASKEKECKKQTPPGIHPGIYPKRRMKVLQS
jgi:hypothetical protein